MIKSTKKKLKVCLKNLWFYFESRHVESAHKGLSLK